MDNVAKIILLFVNVSILTFAQDGVFKNGMATLTLEDHIGHPLYWWPQTLLTYKVGFDEPVNADELILLDGNQKQIAFQTTDWTTDKNGKKEALLHFTSDLPSKGKYIFTLKKGNPEKFPFVSVTERDAVYTVSTEKFTLRIPASQTNQNHLIPGPIAGISMDGGKFIGSSSFAAGHITATGLTTQLINQGPLFAEFELKYVFSDGAVYNVRMRCVQGYEFVEIDEKMDGFTSNDLSWNIRWENFRPTHRQAPNHPYGAPKQDGQGFERYDWERIDQDFLMSHHGILRDTSEMGKIPFDIGIFGNWPAERTLTASLFWDKNTNESVGVFARNHDLWQDHQYSIWYTGRAINIQFFYRDAMLSWLYPLTNGTRSSAISIYPHRKDVDYMDRLEELTQTIVNPDNTKYQVSMGQQSYNNHLHNRYSTLHLNKIKDWCLVYPDSLMQTGRAFRDYKPATTANAFEQQYFYGSFANELPVAGVCQNSGFSPVATRMFYGATTALMEVLSPQMTREQRAGMTAMYLLHAYMADGEDFMPVRQMLSGHPNFLSDVRSEPAFAAYLFPQHPKAKEWADGFDNYHQLNSHYHTRPDVKSWDATGGRWTESIATYFWGYFKAPQRAGYLLQHFFDGKNRMANREYAMAANYAVQALSAPFDGEPLDFYLDERGNQLMHSWGLVTSKNAPHRIYPPQGAHAIRRIPPSGFWLTGKFLEYYDPLLSENIRYLARPEYQDAEMLTRSSNPFNEFIYPLNTKDSGTPPELKSIKMTGYGIILRAAVGTKDELSIHLQQIDEGPNYRWGTANDGGCGNLYFYAAGKSYSNNGREDAGDRRVQDTDMSTNFGVYKNGLFTSIGMNELTRPMYDLGIGQFAEITSSKTRIYSSPEYAGRSVMLIGSDYFFIYDDVFNQNMSTRLSWFTHPNDTLPELDVVKCGVADYIFKAGKPEFSTHQTREAKGVWFDGTGDFLTFVSHKKDFNRQSTAYGCIVTSKDGDKTDYIFRNDKPVDVAEDNVVFSGTAGFIRTNRSPVQEMAIFHGNTIGNRDFQIQSGSTDAGLSMYYSGVEQMHGQFYAMEKTEVCFRWSHTLPTGVHIYIDGVKQKADRQDNGLRVVFPAGKHIWNISKGLPVLQQPVIHYTIHHRNKATLEVNPVPGAEGYLFEYSNDAGKTWIYQETLKQNKSVFVSRQGEEKGYVRVSAVNKEHSSEPSLIYPVYFTSGKPHFPEGLQLQFSENQVNLTWGRVLGCNEYKLYKKQPNGTFRLIYSGKNSAFTDTQFKQGDIFDYAVTSVNGNGESEKCISVTTDPQSRVNFVPVKDELFRRASAAEADRIDQVGPLYYPD